MGWLSHWFSNSSPWKDWLSWNGPEASPPLHQDSNVASTGKDFLQQRAAAPTTWGARVGLCPVFNGRWSPLRQGAAGASPCPGSTSHHWWHLELAGNSSFQTFNFKNNKQANKKLHGPLPHSNFLKALKKKEFLRPHQLWPSGVFIFTTDKYSWKFCFFISCLLPLEQRHWLRVQVQKAGTAGEVNASSPPSALLRAAASTSRDDGTCVDHHHLWPGFILKKNPKFNILGCKPK